MCNRQRRVLPPAVAAALSLLLLAGCGGEQQMHAPPPPEVAVQTVAADAVPLELTYTARTVGSREVEVRARVSGILLKRRFEEGSRVRQGQPMFLIDPEPVRARVASARAEVAVAKARLDEARRQKDRILPLFEQNAVSQSRRDEAVSGFDVARANLAAAQSALRMAQLDLGYTDVRAPIGGLTSREVLSEGSLVKTDQESSLLTRIVQVDPLYVEFSVPEAEAALLRASLAPASGAAKRRQNDAASTGTNDGPKPVANERANQGSNEHPAPSVKLLLENGAEYPQAAKLTFVDNAVDLSSGTVRVRAVLPNPEARLIPGQFIRAKVEGVQLDDVVSIPRKAIMSSAQGPFVWVVADGEKIEMRPVKTGRTMGNDIIVTSGLAAGERYVVEGVLKVQPGIQVSAVSIDAAARQAGSAEGAARAPAAGASVDGGAAGEAVAAREAA